MHLRNWSGRITFPWCRLATIVVLLRRIWIGNMLGLTLITVLSGWGRRRGRNLRGRRKTLKLGRQILLRLSLLSVLYVILQIPRALLGTRKSQVLKLGPKKRTLTLRVGMVSRRRLLRFFLFRKRVALLVKTLDGERRNDPSRGTSMGGLAPMGTAGKGTFRRQLLRKWSPLDVLLRTLRTVSYAPKLNGNPSLKVL